MKLWFFMSICLYNVYFHLNNSVIIMINIWLILNVSKILHLINSECINNVHKSVHHKKLARTTFIDKKLNIIHLWNVNDRYDTICQITCQIRNSLLMVSNFFLLLVSEYFLLEYSKSQQSYLKALTILQRRIGVEKQNQSNSY